LGSERRFRYRPVVIASLGVARASRDVDSLHASSSGRTTMPDVARANLHHVALTVKDLDVSIPWYEQVFGITYQMDGPHEGGVGKLLADPEWA
jgi:hypothetical protein